MATERIGSPASAEQTQPDHTPPGAELQATLSDKAALFSAVAQGGIDRFKSQQARDQTG
jgi:hypothetical protein